MPPVGGRVPLAERMRWLLPVLCLSACGSSTEAPRWKAILVNGGGSVEANYHSHRDHLVGMTDALVQRGLSEDDILVLASDGADPAPDLLRLPAPPDPGTIPAWALAPGPLTDPGGPLAHLWPAMELVDTAWTRTRVGPATVPALRDHLQSTGLSAGDRLLLYTTDHGEPDGSLSLWNALLPPEELASLLADIPPGARVVVAMSQCHSGAFAEPLLALRAGGTDVCGFFSVPADRQATGCFPEVNGAPIGHGFRVSEAWAVSRTLTELQGHLLRFDRGPDVPVRTSDVYLWNAILDEADRRGEDVVRTVDRLLAATPSALASDDRALLADLAGRLGQPVPTRLAELQDHTERWFAAIDAGSFRVEDLALAHQDAALRTQERAFSLATDPSADWSVLLQQAATELGLAQQLPAVLAARTEAEAQLWTWTVQEAVLARMGWLLVRIAGRSLVGGDPALASLLDCESTALPGVPVEASPEAWSVTGPAPAPPELSWVGLRLQPDATGRAEVVAVHPEGPAMGVLHAGERIDAINGLPTPGVESVVLHLALAEPGQVLQVQTDAGMQTLTTAPWPEKLSPAVVPDAGAPAPDALSWIGTPPPGPHLIVWTAAECPTCAAAVQRSRRWAEVMDHSVVVVDDVMFGGLPGAIPDPGGWTADAFAVEMLPTIVAVDGAGQIAWRVDGWSPSEGIDLPDLSTSLSEWQRFPRDLPQPGLPAHGTPEP